MQDQQLKIILSAIDDTKKAFETLQKNLQVTQKETNKTVSSFSTFRTGLRLLGAIIAGYTVVQIVKLNSEYEDLRTTLNLVSGSTSEGAKAFEMLSDLTKNSTLRVKDLADTYQILATSGVKPTKDLLETLQDTFSATGKRIEVLNQLTTLFAKGTQGGLGLMTVQNLIKQGIPVWDILEKQIGVTKDTFASFAETSAGSKQILKALEIGLRETFGGATTARANDLSVSLARIGKEYDLALKSIGEGKLNDAFKQLADSMARINQEGQPFLDFLGDILAFVVKSGSKILDFFSKLAEHSNKIKNLPVISWKDIFTLSDEEIQKKIDKLNQVKIDAKNFEESKVIIDGILDDLDEIVFATKEQSTWAKVSNSIYKQNETAIQNIKNQWGDAEGITKNVMNILNTGIKDFSVGVAESIVLGKSLSDTFRNIAQKFLVSILSTMIELIARQALSALWAAIIGTEESKTLATKIQQLGIEKLITKEKQAQAAAAQSQGGGGNGFFGDILGSIFGSSGGGDLSSTMGSFAEGGSVSAGQPIMVGERGRELFIPSTSGQIVPNQDLTNGASLNFNISANDVRGIKELLIDNRAVIVNIVNQALNARGKASLV